MKERRTLPSYDPLREFGFVLNRWFVRSGVSMKEFAYDLRVSYSIVRQWRKALRWPGPRNLRLISRRTGIAPCGLVCRHLAGVAYCRKCRARCRSK